MMLNFIRILSRILLVLAATVFMASLVMAGALVALVYAGWCVLRGRRPEWPKVFLGPLSHMQRRQPWASRMQPGFRPHGGDAGVVEGQARELT